MSDTGYVAPGYVADGYIGQPGSGVKFLYGAQGITFAPAPLRPTRGLELLQAEEQSTGADRFGFDPYATEDILPLRWPRMCSFDKQKLLDFFLNVAGGMAETFTYVDVDGDSTTVRFAAPQIDIQETAFERFDVQISLMVAS